MSHMKSLNDAVHPYRQLVIEHPLHANLTDLGRVRTFMEYHIFAVWDFMCLLKALQRLVTCFVLRTMDVIHPGSPHTIAAAFTVGREKVIPGMFMEIISRLAPGCPTLHDYFRRHIDIDGNSHGLLSERLLSSLCGSDPAKWSEATESAVDALRSRMLLWDAILEKFNEGTGGMRRAA